MSKEYIEREEAIKELCQVSAPTPSESYIVEKCIDKLDNMSATDVVEVVRCSECMHKHDMIGSSYRYCAIHNMKVYCDDFCSYGERKAD